MFLLTKKTKEMRKSLFIVAVIGLTIANAACNRNKNNPGYAFFPDMAYSTAYESFTPNPVFSDGQTMRTPAEGTIARDHFPYPYKAKSFDDQVKAGQELHNPFQKSPEILAEGKALYNIFCISCHGVAGKGDGHLYTSKLFPAKPTSLVDPFVQNKPDGEIYHVITLGSISGLMAAHGSQIRPDDRWKIILYVRELAK